MNALGGGPRGGVPSAHGHWLALLSVPRFGGRRLWDVWSGPGPEAALADLRRGVVSWSPAVDGEVRRAWQAAAVAADPDELAHRHRSAGVDLTVHGDGVHPCGDERDPYLPPVLLWRGVASPVVAGGPDRSGPPRVGIIGTRRATRYGVDLARELGRSLAAAGVCVVSGLAAGIDAAAHHGALDSGDGAGAGAAAAPLAVIGTGLDVVYPRRNRALWDEIVRAGLLVSEHPLGTAPAAWRFPARNRVLAALCDAIVVVESHERGGSLITAGLAGTRGVPVLAVPGAVHHPGSRGTNRLIADGCQPCLSPDDVFDALSLLDRPASGRPPVTPSGNAAGREGASAPSGDHAEVLEALGWTRRTFDDLLARCPGLEVADVALALAELQSAGRVAVDDGWYEQVR